MRKPEQLAGLDGLVIPGGESTAIGRLVRLYGLEEALRAFERADLRHLRRDDPARPRRTSASPTSTSSRNAYGRQVASFEADLELERRRRAAARRLHPRARGSRTSAPSVEVLAELDGQPVLVARRPHPGRGVPPGADRRHAGPRAVSRAGEGGDECPGIASGRRSSTRRAPPTRSAASSSRSSRARSSSRPRRAAPIRRQPRARERDREGALVLDAEGQHRSRDRARLRRGRRRRGVRARRLRGLRPERRRRDRRGADRQPQPHRVRRPRTLFAKYDGNLGGSGAVAWLFERRGRDARRRRGRRRGRPDARRGRGRSRRRRARRLELPCHGRPESLSAVREAIEEAGIDGRVRRADDGAEDHRRASRTRAPPGRCCA